MLSTALFGITIAFSFIVWGLVARQYFWPALRGRSDATERGQAMDFSFPFMRSGLWGSRS